MKDCLFCKIINNEIPSSTVYEDDLIKVFLDINPTTNGHMLIIPKKHHVNVMDIDEDVVSHALKVIREKLYPMLKENLGCDGLTIVQNNEYGQEVKHYHIHLIPRYQDDLVSDSYNKEMLIPVEEVFARLSK
ncbi:MAG: HIT domain-containing protein [bacterium]|nr:HIT domain-containing protein [bacterium]